MTPLPAAMPTVRTPLLRRLLFLLVVGGLVTAQAIAGPARALAAAPGTATVSGTVTDAATGRPVAGATVSIANTTDQATSAADGTYRIVTTPGDRRVKAVAPQYVPAWFTDTSGSSPSPTVTLTDGQDRTGVSFALARFATATGLVTAADGSGPVSGVVVKALPHGSTDYTPTSTATTTSTGTWTMTDLPAGTYDLQFDASDTDFLSQWWSGAATRDEAGLLTATAGGTQSGLNASLTRGATISGRVVDEKGQPVPNVYVSPREQVRGWVGGTDASTAADGTFTVRGLVAGQYTLEFRSDDHVPWSYGMKDTGDAPSYFSVPEGASVTGRSMVLPLGATISGTARTADSKPDASLYVLANNTGRGDSPSSGVNSDGTWVIKGLDTGTYKLMFAGQGYVTQWWLGAATADAASAIDVVRGSTYSGKDATLTPGTPSGQGTVRGRLLAAGTNAPIAGAQVWVTCSDDASNSNNTVGATTAPDGTFGVDIPAGSCTADFDATASGFVHASWQDPTGRADFTLTPGGTTDLGTTILRPGASMSGHVYAGSTTRPMAGAQVIAIPADSYNGDWSPLYTYTDDTGAYALRGLPGDVYTIHVVPDAATGYMDQWWKATQKRSLASYAVMAAGSSRAGMDAVLVRAGSLSGRATTTDGTPVSGVVVQAVPAGAQFGVQVQTDTDGNFTIGGLAPAAYALSFDGQAVGYQTRWFSSTSPSGATSRDAASTITLTAGGALSGYTVQLARAGSVTGTVTGPGGVPVANASISVSPVDDATGSWGSASTDVSGKYDTGGLPAGRYVVQVNPPDGSGLAAEYFDNAYSSSTATPVVVADGAAARADVALAPGGTISGRVLRPDGTPVTSGAVLVAPAGDRASSSYSEVAADGTFTVAGVGAGSYVVSAIADGTVQTYWVSATSSTVDSAAAAPVAVVAGGTTPGITIRLSAGASISGHVTAPAGTTLSGTVIVVDVRHNYPAGSGPIDASGAFTVSGLPAGTYAVWARNGNASVWYGNVQSWADSTFVVLASTTARTGVDLALPAATAVDPTSVVHGHVTLPSGTTTGFGDLGIWLEDGNGSQFWASQVQADGTFEVTDVPAGSLTVHLRDWGQQQLILAATSVTTPTTSVLELHPVAGGAVTGLVQNEGGKPLAYVMVSATDASGQGTWAYSGNDGTYRVTGLAAGPVRVHVEPYSPYISTWAGGTRTDGTGAIFTVALGSTTAVPPTTVLLGGSITGSVRLPAGINADGSSVDAIDAAGHVVASTSLSGGTDYELHSVPAGAVKVRFSGQGLTTSWWTAPGATAPSTVTVVAGQTVEHIDATLMAAAPSGGTTGAASVAGTITVQGLSAAGAQVLLARAGDGVVVASGWSGADGAYRVDGLPAGDYRIEVQGCIFFGGGGRIASRDVSPSTSSDPGDPTCVTKWWPGGDLASARVVTVAAGAHLTAYDLELASGKVFTTAPKPVVSGSAVVGGTLKVTDGTWAPAPTSLTHRWLVGGVAVTGQTGGTFTPRPEDLGKTVTVETTATLSGYATQTTTSTATAAVAAGTLTAPTPTISGTAKVGSTLTAAPGTWGPSPVTLAYQWRRNGTAITGATAATYVLSAADKGTTVTVSVTGSKTAYTTASRTSAATVAVAAGTLSAAPTPTISGTAKVGYRLTAAPGTWGPAPVTLAYQWRRNGVAITGATGSTYLLGAADLATRTTVTVTGSKAGYTSIARTSAATAAVVAGTLTATPTPKITGTVKVGYRLTATPGTWSPAPVTLGYQWRRNGVAITGATGSTYLLGAADRTTKITVTVTGRKAGYTTIARTSAATVAVATGTLTATPTPKITGTTRVGYRLTATAGTWSPAPVTLSYQWRRNGVAITGATGSTYLLTRYDKGKHLTVTVTGRKAGYTTIARTSAQTVAIG
ncbi:carboxypeptidase regulatory-like domain-containing protein [Terrabacter sp. NPDC080008]|uniref:carboxypeptidase regulatory-like domain-containing protein n=1 Tax=Terrabacter sp. NPDC080008 TaxID=3155176 RepID=UPI00344FFF2E